MMSSKDKPCKRVVQKGLLLAGNHKLTELIRCLTLQGRRLKRPREGAQDVYFCI